MKGTTVITNERPVPCDVDDTLIMTSGKAGEYPDLPRIVVTDPLDPTKVLVFAVNVAMVRILKEEIARGAFTIVWSRGGFAWAEIICNKLELKVDLIMTKPAVYLDDKPVEQWLKDRVYIGPETTYKSIYKP